MLSHLLGARSVLVPRLHNSHLFLLGLVEGTLDLRIKATFRGIVRTAFKSLQLSHMHPCVLMISQSYQL